MKSYNSLKQFVDDFKLYRVARRIDPGRDDGETLSSLILKRINLRLNNPSKQFKAFLDKNHYTTDDLILIGTHDSLRRIEDIEGFLRKAYNVNFVNERLYRRLFLSNAFKKGRLKMLEPIIPRVIFSKIELLRFIKSRHGISKREISIVMQSTGKKQWRTWLAELIEEGMVTEIRGRLH